MTFSELKIGLEKWSELMRQVFFDPKGTTYTEPGVDCIANLESSSSRKLGKKWNNTINYLAGDIISYNFEIYLALTNNINIIPENNTGTWKILSLTQLERGSEQAKAWVYYQINLSSNHVPAVLESYNIESVSVLDPLNYQVFFSAAAFITDTNYAVHITSLGSKAQNYAVYDKSSTSFKFKFTETIYYSAPAFSQTDNCLANIVII